MKNLENLKKQVDAQRRSGRGPFPESLKNQIIKAAEGHGKAVVIKSLELSPSSFYKWLKNSNLKHKQSSLESTTFVEIPQTPKPRPNSLDLRRGSEVQVKWEAVRPDGSILRCELMNQKAEIGAIFNSFLDGVGAP